MKQSQIESFKRLLKLNANVEEHPQEHFCEYEDYLNVIKMKQM